MVKKYSYIIAYKRKVLEFPEFNRKVDEISFVFKNVNGSIMESTWDFDMFADFVRDLLSNDCDEFKTCFFDLTDTGLDGDVDSYQFKKIGRPSLGDTKKVSVTLPSEFWDKIDSIDMKKSELFRELVYNYLDGYLDMFGYKQKE